MAKAQPERLAESDIGAWIVQGNPQLTWDYFAAREEDGVVPGDLIENGWTLHTSYRVDLMQEGDFVILWLTGNRRGDYWPGVYEIGLLSGGAVESFGIDSDHLLDPDYVNRSGHYVDFVSYVLPKPLRSVDLREDPRLANCEKFRVPMLGNPLHLTPLETVALSAHLPKKALKEAGWEKALKDPFYTKATE